jgi:S-DNA-T family DNA segregation ATPase FtsK/SpoIIIE
MLSIEGSLAPLITHCSVVSTSKPPPFAALAPDGSRIVVHPHASTDSVEELARALDLPASSAVAIDGRVVRRHERLTDVGLRVGSSITVAPDARPDPPHDPPHDLPQDPPHDRVSEGESGGMSARASAGADGFVDGVEVAIATGPACGPWTPLGAGRHTVGRAASADVWIDDVDVELHHGVLVVGVDGSLRFAQLTGRVPATVDGEVCGGTHCVPPGGVLRLGTSELLFRSAPRMSPERMSSVSRSTSAGSVVASDRDPWRRIVRRAPAVPASRPVEPIEVPEPPGSHRAPPLTSLVGASVAVAGAGLLAALLGQAMFALFAAIGALASFATWAVGAIAARRERRRTDATHRAAVEAFGVALRRGRSDADHRHRLAHPSVVDTLGIALGDGGDLWSRRTGPTDPLRATVGRGTCRWYPPIDDEGRRRLDPDMLVTLSSAERLPDVSVPVTLAPRSVLAVHGPDWASDALCRSIVVQLAVHYGPADWQVMVVSSRPEQWSWVGWLPHATDGAASVVDARDTDALTAALERSVPSGRLAAAELAASDDDGVKNGADGRQLLVVLDVPELLTTRTGPLRRRFDHGDMACVASVPTEVSVPAMATQVFDVGTTARGRWTDTVERSTWDTDTTGICVAGISARTAEAVALRLAPLVDPEQHDTSGGVPATVSLADLEPIDSGTSTVIARRWMHGGRDPRPLARLGMSADGVVDIDLVRDGPHGLIAGTTGAGKSELLRTLVVSLAAHVSPDHLTMVLVDFKGGSTFDACARLPHTVGVVTDLDDGLAERVLVSLDAEVRRRERLLRSAAVDDLTSYRRSSHPPLSRLVVVIDEFASLAKELPEFLHALVDVAQRGRSLGVHLLLATQRPAGVVTDDIRANTNLRIALRLQDRRDAIDVVGDAIPASFPVAVAGRAALRLGPGQLVTFQTANSSAASTDRSSRLSIERTGRSTAHTARRAADDPLPADAGRSMLVQLTDAICDAAVMVGVEAPHRPWIDVLPELLTPQQLTHALDDATGGGSDRESVETDDAVGTRCSAVIGLADDPARQCRVPLVWRPGDGNVLLVGAIGAGTTTAAAAVVAALVRGHEVDALHVYVIDARGDEIWERVAALAHCGAVIRLGEVERLIRLLRHLAGEMDRRSALGGRTPQVVVVLDGAAPVRESLDAVTMADAVGHLDRLVRDGPALGFATCITTDGSSTSALSVPRSSTLVFRLDDPAIARSLGVRAVAAGVPGRLRIVESGLEAQVVFDPDPFDVRQVGHGGPPRPVRPRSIGVLPEVVDAERLDASLTPAVADGELLQLVVGLDADDLEPASLRVPMGDHVFIGGGARTGRSTALRQIEASWRRLHPDGIVVIVDRRHRLDLDVALGADSQVDRSLLVVVDDADRVDDPDGRLTNLIASRTPGLTVVVAARLEAVRVAYGHWTRDVARSRCGLIMTSAGDVDGELLGATLPRRSMIPSRPGLAWLIDQRGHRLVQVAARMPP